MEPVIVERGRGIPLLALHGFPCTSRLWTRMLPLAVAAGFEVAAPDLRGFGDADLPPDDRYDLAAHCGDLVGLCTSLGWSRVVVVAHDLGASIALELARRHPHLVDRLLLSNHVVPPGPRPIADEALPDWSPEEASRIFAYAERQGHDADALMSELDTPAARIGYVASFYRDRGWCPPDAFGPADVAWLAEPFGSAGRLRASFRDYEIGAGRYLSPEPELTKTPVEHRVRLVLGPDDETLRPGIVRRAELAYPRLEGVELVPGTGHFLPWEAPERLVAALADWCADVAVTS